MTHQQRLTPSKPPPPRPSSPPLLCTAVSQTLSNLRATRAFTPSWSPPQVQALWQSASAVRLPPPLTPPRLVLVLLILLFLLPLLFSSPALPHTPLQTRRRAHLLSTQPGNTRAHALAAALRSWAAGPAPPPVLAAAAACSERDAHDAAFRALATFPGALRRYAVVDVGAGPGTPLARLALAKGLRWVLAVEPHPAMYTKLQALRRRGVKFVPVKAALSDRAGERDIAFAAEPDGACFGCDGPVEPVSTHTLDELVIQGKLGVFDDAPVAMLSVGVRGHEGRVLAGGKELLASGRVLYARIRVDVTAGRDDTLTCLRELLGAGLKCVSLRFDGVEERDVEKYPMFGQQISWRTAEVFYQFVNATGKSTNLFCAKRAG